MTISYKVPKGPKYNKLVNKTNKQKKQTHRYRQKTGGYQGWWEGNIGVREWEVQLLGVTQAQGFIVQHRKYRQYFVITVNGVYALKIILKYFLNYIF